jgi:hypothetical protein
LRSVVLVEGNPGDVLSWVVALALAFVALFAVVDVAWLAWRRARGKKRP